MSVYLDHNATTPLDPKVYEAMSPYMLGCFGNPSSQHRYGCEARAALEQAREQLAGLVNAHPSQVIFTSGGTEANNMVFRGLSLDQAPGAMAISAIEHPSVLQPCEALSRGGWQIHSLAVDAQGLIEQDGFASALAGNARLVSVMLANNEVGVVQDIPALAAQAREQGKLFHTDAVQALGKIKVDFAASGVHLMSLSSHKIYGPKGCGALIVDKSVDLPPIMLGGGQEKGRRAGTENVAAIVGFGMAAQLAAEALESRQIKLLQLREYLEQQLLAMEGVTVFAQQAARLPNTVMFAVGGLEGETMLMNLDAAGFAVSSGSACESGSAEPSHVLMAMGVPHELAYGALRVSLGKDNTVEDVDAFVRALQQQIQVFRNMASCLPV